MTTLRRSSIGRTAALGVSIILLIPGLAVGQALFGNGPATAPSGGAAGAAASAPSGGMASSASSAGAAASAPAGEATSKPSAFTTWGQSKMGLAVSLSADPAPSAGGEFDLTAGLRNTGTAAVKLPASSKVVGWFLAGQQAAEDKKFYTQRFFVALTVDDWPTELEPGAEVVFKKISIGEGTVYSSKHAKELLAAYVSNKVGAEIPASEGRLMDVLAVGPANIRFTLLLALDDGRTEALNSNVVEIKVCVRPLAGMSAQARKDYIADLLRQFDKDEWNASKAHDQGVAVGKEIVPDLIEAVKDRKRPKFSRMWLATTLADIRDDRAAEALADLLEDPVPDVKYVVCYHGPKQKSDSLDAAIIKKVESSKETGATAYALLGFVVFRGTAPKALLDLSLDHPDAKMRTALGMALRNHASDFNMAQLTKLATDPDEQTRIQAVRVLQQFGRKNPDMFRAIAAALEPPGETARQKICQILGEMTGINAPYDPKADLAAREKTLKTWRDWAARAPKRPN